jgi:hypothetical protein
MSPAEYLSTSFENPDREYVHGEIVERGTPDYSHGRMQVELGFRASASGPDVPAGHKVTKYC